MVIAIFDQHKKVLFMPGDTYDAFRNHFGPPDSFWAPLNPLVSHFCPPSCGKGVFIINKVTFQIQKCNGYMSITHDSHIETPELLLGPLKSP